MAEVLHGLKLTTAGGTARRWSSAVNLAAVSLLDETSV